MSTAPKGVTQENWDRAARHAGLGVGHFWQRVQCPAYTTFDPADCDCMIELRAWDDIPADRRRETNGEREVLGCTFLGPAAWLPHMGRD